MNEELLNNIWNYLTSQGQIQVSFEEWKDNVSDNQEIQINIHKYLTDKGEITNTFEEWQDKTGLKKKSKRKYRLHPQKKSLRNQIRQLVLRSLKSTNPFFPTLR